MTVMKDFKPEYIMYSAMCIAALLIFFVFAGFLSDYHDDNLTLKSVVSAIVGLLLLVAFGTFITFMLV